LRRITPGVAELLVAEDRAEVAHSDGRIRSVKPIEITASHAGRIGEPIKPTGPTSVRFARKVQTEAGTYYEHDPRATDYGE
jgi:hypothetical protein